MICKNEILCQQCVIGIVEINSIVYLVIYKYPLTNSFTAQIISHTLHTFLLYELGTTTESTL